MAGYRFTPEADADLFEIWSYIARDNPDAADRVEAASCDACNHSRRVSDERPSAQRIHIPPGQVLDGARFPNYLIVYRPDARPLEIIRILHGMRDVKRILAPPKG